MRVSSPQRPARYQVGRHQLDPSSFSKNLGDLMSSDHQLWLLGAGVSIDACIPLMVPLTRRVKGILEEGASSGADAADIWSDYQAISAALPPDHHIEHVLTYLADLMSLTDRRQDKRIELGPNLRQREHLARLYTAIVGGIETTIRWGYVAPRDGAPEIKGRADKRIVSLDSHRRFVRALFNHSRKGKDRRPPVAFFTLNYDTLLEDALGHERIPYADMFTGGGVAYWDLERSTTPIRDPFSPRKVLDARVFKLHGSIDWRAIDERRVVRHREGAGYPEPAGSHVLIYPQATKYVATQRDPFASLFAAFRSALSHREQVTLFVCGYSFGDEHVNLEIERALCQKGNALTVVAFCDQRDNLDPLDALPPALRSWLDGSSLPEGREKQIHVVGRRALYHGSTTAYWQGAPKDWWTFRGVTKLLEDGVPSLK